VSVFSLEIERFAWSYQGDCICHHKDTVSLIKLDKVIGEGTSINSGYHFITEEWTPLALTLDEIILDFLSTSKILVSISSPRFSNSLVSWSFSSYCIIVLLFEINRSHRRIFDE
jgi:hypothetical protein